MNEIVIRENRDTVVKSNELIQASHSLTLNHQRLILSAIAQIAKGHKITEQTMYPVTVDEFADMAGYSKEDRKNAYLRLKETANTIVGQAFYIDEEKKKRRTLVQSANYVDGEGYVEIRFSYDMIPFISELKERFTMYLIEEVKGFKSSYGLRLFELIMQYKGFGTREIEILWLRKMWNLENKYKSIKDFKLKVIKPAIDDINERSGWEISYNQRKSGRKVTHLIFTFNRKVKDLPKPVKRRSPSPNEWTNLLRYYSKPGETTQQARGRIQGLINKGEISLV